MTALIVTTDTTRAELIEALGNLCASAKAMSRRGPVGTLSAEYAKQHACINAMLDDLEIVSRG